jgi:sugar O-acyltransferase (sialic acid O-acetyltransferase NeuD family)
VLAILGAGGHAKVVIATARAAGRTELACYDDAVAARGRELLGVAVVGPLAEILEDPEAEAVLAIGSNAARQQLAARARCRFATLVHPFTAIDPSVRLGAGTVVFAGAVIQPDTSLGEHVIVNTGGSIDHDCRVGSYAHLGPGVRLAGTVDVGEGAFVGIGSAVIPGVRIGAWSTVGAGAAVVRDIPDGATAVGVPARPRPG